MVQFTDVLLKSEVEESGGTGKDVISCQVRIHRSQAMMNEPSKQSKCRVRVCESVCHSNPSYDPLGSLDSLEVVQARGVCGWD